MAVSSHGLVSDSGRSGKTFSYDIVCRDMLSSCVLFGAISCINSVFAIASFLLRDPIHLHMLQSCGKQQFIACFPRAQNRDLQSGRIMRSECQIMFCPFHYSIFLFKKT